MILDDRITAVVGCCIAIVHPEEKVRDVPYTSQNIFCGLYIGGSSPPGKAGGKQRRVCPDFDAQIWVCKDCRLRSGKSRERIQTETAGEKACAKKETGRKEKIRRNGCTSTSVGSGDFSFSGWRIHPYGGVLSGYLF